VSWVSREPPHRASPEPHRVKVRIAHSPDADDAFMFFGIAAGAVDLRGLELVHEAADIERLNERAARGDLEASAISFGAWPAIADRYDLMPVGASFGLGYGPRVVAREPLSVDDLRAGDRTVAIPGERTTAALLLRLMLPGVRTKAVTPFDRVPQAVLAGEADAGVVIHEGQLTHEAEGLRLVRDLGAWWHEESGGLPVPLGANAVRRDLDRDVVARLTAVLRDSIAHALAHREDALVHALANGRGLDLETGGRYVGMYVNELSIDAGPSGRAAVVDLYARGARAGLLPSIEPRWSDRLA
jgi:1,4-dihydroxy-6-naphthoate synthase